MIVRTLASSWSSWMVAGIAALAQGGSCQKDQAGAGEATKDTPGPQVTLEGVDTSALTVREKREWSSYVSKYQAPCPGVGTVAECVQGKKTCDACMPAAKFLLGLVRDGRTEEQVDAAYKNRFDPAAVKDVGVDESPSKGPENAEVTIVEFADFQCPHCGLMAPVVKKAWRERRANVKVVFKFLPLPMHPQAEPAAKAAVAAWRQGKFWDMHDKLFANQMKLDSSDLDRYAKEIGLDLGKFRTDMESTTTKDRIERDKKLSDQLQVSGTPTFYINGRNFDVQQDLGAWLDTELKGKGLDPAKVKEASLAMPEHESAAPASSAGAGAPAASGKTAAPAASSAKKPAPKPGQ